MIKIIFRLLVILALAVLCGVAGFYAMSANAKGNNDLPTPTASAMPSPTAEPHTCTVITGIDKGTVNLRACPGAECGSVLDILTEGSSLDIIIAGEWINVTTARGVAGWINSKYCKEDK